MFANISPCLSCSENTLNTLRYADRVKDLRKNNISNNKKFKDDNYKDMMVLPRNTNTIKYNVTLKKSFTINNKGKNGNFKRKEILKMNDIVNGRKKKQNLSLNKPKQIIKKNNVIESYSDNEYNDYEKVKNNRKTFSKTSTSKSMNLFSTSKIPTINNEKSANINDNINKNNNNNNNINNNTYISKYSNLEINSEKEKEKYNNEYSKLIDLLLEKQQQLRKFHHKHINEITITLNKEKNLIDNNDPDFDIKVYINNMRNLLDNEIESIKTIQSKINDFENLLKDEEILSNKLNIENSIDSN